MNEIRTFVHVEFDGIIGDAESRAIRSMVVGADGMPDFGILLPMPKDVAEDNDGCLHFAFSMSNGPKWRYSHWGCDWNGENARFDESADGFAFTVDTVCKPPIGWVKAFAKAVDKILPGASVNGVWVPSKFGNIEFGEFRCLDGKFEIVKDIEWDEPLMVKRVWEYDDEDLLAFRGFVEDENEDKPVEESQTGVEPFSETELPWVIGETPIEELREKVRQFVRRQMSA